ncbi:MAG: acyl transferase [Bacteroidota bacterium]
MTKAIDLDKQRLLNISPGDFTDKALAIFRHQAEHCLIYKQYLDLLRISPLSITDVAAIPFLPIQFFKQQVVKTGDWQAASIFTSSGTTGQMPSRHFVKDLSFYLENTRSGFEQYFDGLQNYVVLALLPSYLERSGSSLVAMADYFIKISKYSESDFFLNNTEQLIETLQSCQHRKVPTLLIGVSFALLDLAERYSIDLSHITIMETGGMKGRRKELIRTALHQTLKTAFHVEKIYSEYGMTELLSQAYTKGGERFYPSTTMKILIRDTSDPFHILGPHRNGVVNIIDLANVDSCSFIATQDLGRTYEDGSFEILGRLDQSELRGCNLMLFDV